MKAVTQMNRKSLRAQTKLGTTMCPERDDKRWQESCRVPVSVSPVNKNGERSSSSSKHQPPVRLNLRKESSGSAKTREPSRCREWATRGSRRQTTLLTTATSGQPSPRSFKNSCAARLAASCHFAVFVTLRGSRQRRRAVTEHSRRAPRH